jgi:hypothetical protein
MNLIRSALIGLAILAVAGSGHARENETPQPPSGQTLNIFLFAGQSNMEGRADGGKLSKEDRNRLDRVRDRISLIFNGESACPLDTVAPAPEIGTLYQCDQIFGPELFFGIALAEAWPEERFLFIKRTAGATTLHGAWNPAWSREKAAATNEVESPRLYHKLAADVRDATDGLTPADYTFRGMLWVQGEGDGTVPEAAQVYGDNLRTLIAQIRKDTGQESLPFLLFEVGGPDVVRGMRRVAAEIPGIHLLPQSPEPGATDFYEKLENGHYNHEGMKKLGLRFAEAYLRATETPRP